MVLIIYIENINAFVLYILCSVYLEIKVKGGKKEQIHANNVPNGVVFTLNSKGGCINYLCVPLIRNPVSITMKFLSA